MVDFLGMYNLQMSMIESIASTEDSLDLSELGYRFAIQKIDPKYGQIKVEMIERTGPEGEEFKSTEVKMLSCDDEIVQDDEEYLFNDIDEDSIVPVYSKKSNYICPDPSQHIEVRGQFHQKVYKYLSIKINGCDLEDQSQCTPTEELVKKKVHIEIL